MVWESAVGIHPKKFDRKANLRRQVESGDTSADEDEEELSWYVACREMP